MSFHLIYASDRLKALARIWKIKFNENSKIPAFYNCFPELNHNELMGFEGSRPNLHLVILRDLTDHPRIQKRMKLMAEILKPRKIPADFVDLQGKDVLYKVFSNILLGDWASYYLALKNKIDPTPVKLNDEFKKRMAR